MADDRIQPLIIGRGMAGQALRHALLLFPEEIAPSRWLERGDPLPAPENPATALLVVAGPHALHTPRLLEAAEQGYRYAICEKPAAVDLDQVATLEELPTATWICHGYRLLWGPRQLKEALDAGCFGQLISIEGRYWHSSATRESTAASWKDAPELGGQVGALLDLATHWADLVTYVRGGLPDKTAVRRWFVNAPSSSRDTHVHLTMEFGDLLSFGSISKTVHGAGNILEISILGERASASWSFQNPDVVVWGDKGAQTTQGRSESELPSRPAPFHGLGWMEGYGRLVGEVVAQMRGDSAAEATTLREHLDLLSCLLQAAEAESTS